MNRAEITDRVRCWRRHGTARLAWLGAAGGFASAALVVRSSPAAAAALGAIVLALALVVARRRAAAVTPLSVVHHLNRICPTLEESAELWLRPPETLDLVERLQHRRLDAAWNACPDRSRLGYPPRTNLRPARTAFFLAAVTLALVLAWPPRQEPVPIASQAASPRVRSSPAPVLPAVRSAVLEIKPPSYLARSMRRVEGLDAEVEEGAQVTWKLESGEDVTGLEIQAAGGTAPLVAEPLGDGRFRASTTLTGTLVYQVVAIGADGSRHTAPAIHALRILRDQPPRLTWTRPATTRTFVDPAAATTPMAIQLIAEDDHGLAEARLVMTLATGSGEGVKFRERVVPLPVAPAPGPGGALLEHVLDPAALGLEPGDELYLQVIAGDRREPSPNEARSETRFLALRGPATRKEDAAVTLAGVDRLPAYFRSQRQVILDTERLLAEEPTLPKPEFRHRSEELGLDQKLLRLRYGEFLGEEFEAEGAGAAPEAHAETETASADRPSPETPDRDAAIERAIESRHPHTEESEREGRLMTVEELLAPFVHNHDDPEAATLFDEQVKASLRSVLSAMWEAEGFLRTARPADALPAEYRALERLKALQQAGRVSVRRVGYEPAPLNLVERRLRGDLEGIPGTAQRAVPVPEPDPGIVALRTALGALAAPGDATLAAEQVALVDSALVAAARAEPDRYLRAVEHWRRGRETLRNAERHELSRALWSLLPATRETPRRPRQASPRMERAYVEALAAAREERP